MFKLKQKDNEKELAFAGIISAALMALWVLNTSSVYAEDRNDKENYYWDMSHDFDDEKVHTESVSKKKTDEPKDKIKEQDYADTHNLKRNESYKPDTRNLRNKSDDNFTENIIEHESKNNFKGTKGKDYQYNYTNNENLSDNSNNLELKDQTDETKKEVVEIKLTSEKRDITVDSYLRRHNNENKSGKVLENEGINLSVSQNNEFNEEYNSNKHNQSIFENIWRWLTK